MRRFAVSSRDSSSNRSFYMRSKLPLLDFKSFQRVVWLWLAASGYQNLRTLSRGHRRGRGSVGPDFLVRVGEDGLEVAVQIRHWKSPLTKRAVDELRGVLLRDEIPAGMIVCPSKVSKAARTAAADYSGRPIRVIGLESLADSITALGISDSAFFRCIGATSLGLAVNLASSKGSSRSVDLSTPDNPEPNRSHWIVAGVLMALLALWLARGLIR